MSSESTVLSVDEAVRAFLQIAMLHPEKAPKTQRAERDNSMMIVGFNQAQEALRSILKAHGETVSVQDLGEVRADGQQRPLEVGGLKAWVVG